MKYSLLALLFFTNFLAAQTDYEDLANWYYHPDKLFNLVDIYDLDIAVIDRELNIETVIPIENNAGTDTGVDVFWVHPTQLVSVPAVPTSVPIADQPAATITVTILAQGSLLAKYGRFFAPKYRQASPSSFLGPMFSDAERAAALLETYSDVKASFLHYLENHNNGNRIILAGHSQGSFLLGMLLRDVFDNNPTLREQLLTAALGGMGFVYASPGDFQEGWWENIPLCTTTNECGCVHNWRSFKEEQVLLPPSTSLPAFNSVLVDSGQVYRTIDLTNDWFVQDSLVYGASASPLRYYIAPDANYNLGGGANFIAFDSLFTARFKRVSPTKAVLSIDYVDDPTDQRPNDLLEQEDHPNYNSWGFHIKDYHIYLWALMEQIDHKLAECAMLTNLAPPLREQPSFGVYPNPSNGAFTVDFKENCSAIAGEKLRVIDVFGRLVKTVPITACQMEVNIETKGVYWLVADHESRKVVVH